MYGVGKSLPVTRYVLGMFSGMCSFSRGSSPRDVRRKKPRTNFAVSYEMCTQPGTPVLSIALAIYTVYPHKSKATFLIPITPATTGPEWMPRRICNGGRDGCLRLCYSNASKNMSPASTTRNAWSLMCGSNPPAMKKASPMVLIFSSCNIYTTVSNYKNTSFRKSTI